MQKHHRGAVGSSHLHVPDIQAARIDLLHGAKRRSGVDLARRRVCGAGHFAPAVSRSDRNAARIS